MARHGSDICKLEVCVDTLDGIDAAIEGGADRVELCSALSEGGLTPSHGFMKAAAKKAIPCYAMIRPRCGDFCYSDDEIDVMAWDIAAARDAGLAGVVFGIQSADLSLSAKPMARLLKTASHLSATLHRVADATPDPFASLETAIELGFENILTSGRQKTAAEGMDLLRDLVARADGRITIMPGGGVTDKNVGTILESTKANAIHSSCSMRLASDPVFEDFSPVSGRRVTGVSEVRALRTAIEGVLV